MGRRTVVAVAVALSTVVAGCSVPRERDASTAPSPATPSATGAGAELVAVPSAVAAVPSASPSVSPSVSPSPSPAPVRAPVPHQVAGYALTAAPRTLGNPLDVVRAARDLFCAGTARSVVRGGTRVGVLMLLALRPEYVGDHGIEAMLVPKVVAGITSGGVTPAFRTWSGLRVGVAMSAKDGTIVVWYTRGVLGVVVGGADPAVVTGYARAYVASR